MTEQEFEDVRSYFAHQIRSWMVNGDPEVDDVINHVGNEVETVTFEDYNGR